MEAVAALLQIKTSETLHLILADKQGIQIQTERVHRKFKYSIFILERQGSNCAGGWGWGGGSVVFVT